MADNESKIRTIRVPFAKLPPPQPEVTAPLARKKRQRPLMMNAPGHHKWIRPSDETEEDLPAPRPKLPSWYIANGKHYYGANFDPDRLEVVITIDKKDQSPEESSCSCGSSHEGHIVTSTKKNDKT